jgi:hypothetical protein
LGSGRGLGKPTIVMWQGGSFLLYKIYIQLNVNNGITIMSTKDINISSEGNINFTADKKILFAAEDEIRFKCKDSHIKMDSEIEVVSKIVKVN